MDEILKSLEIVETLAEDILKDKQEIIDLNIKHNKTREAINALKRSQISDKNSNKLWFCFGNSFIKTPISSAKTMITEEQNDLNKRITELRDGLKPKVDLLRQSEGKEVLKGFDLKALDRNEFSAVSQAFN